LILLLLSFLLFGQSGFPIQLVVKSDPVFSDLILNGDFSIYDSACVSIHSAGHPCPDPIGSGCINSWKASHGSPEFSVNDRLLILGAISTNGYVWGEGTFQNLNQPIDSGESYLLLFTIHLKSEKDIGNSSLSVQFTNQEFYSGTCFEMLPAPGWEIPGSPFTAGYDQRSVVAFFNAGGTFNKIWFSANTESDSVTWIKIGNIHLFNLNDIPVSALQNILDKIFSDENKIQLMLSENCSQVNHLPAFTTIPCQK